MKINGINKDEWKCGGQEFIYATKILDSMGIPQIDREKVLEICRDFDERSSVSFGRRILIKADFNMEIIKNLQFAHKLCLDQSSTLPQPNHKVPRNTPKSNQTIEYFRR